MSDKFFDIQVNINTNTILSKYQGRMDAAQKFLDNEVVRQSRPYIPFVQGLLANTVVVEEPGMIVYVQPYARSMYYGDGFNFTKSFHPNAGARWTDRAKAAHLPDWKKGVEKILKGGNL